MSNTIIYQFGRQWVFCDIGGDFSSGAPATAANSLIAAAPADVATVQMDLGALAAGGAYASAKANLTTTRARQFSLDVFVEYATAPADGEVVSYYWAPSPASAAATGNPAGLTGAQGSVTYSAGLMGQMIHVGDLTLTTALTAGGHVGVFEPPHQYGMLVAYNQSAADAFATVVDEVHAVLSEIKDVAQ